MKTLVSNKHQDFVITYNLKVVRKEGTEDIVYDENNGLAKHLQNVQSVGLYVHEVDYYGHPTAKATKVSIPVEGILMLADKIRAMSTVEVFADYDESMDDFYDLPF